MEAARRTAAALRPLVCGVLGRLGAPSARWANRTIPGQIGPCLPGDWGCIFLENDVSAWGVGVGVGLLCKTTFLRGAWRMGVHCAWGSTFLLGAVGKGMFLRVALGYTPWSCLAPPCIFYDSLVPVAFACSLERNGEGVTRAPCFVQQR